VKRKCSPQTVTKTITAPKKKLECFNCGCLVRAGKCHCGADNYWAFDYYDGWHRSGSIQTVVTR
jgi:hypothetical protein